MAEWKKSAAVDFDEELECELGGKKVIFGVSGNDRECAVGVYTENSRSSFVPHVYDDMPYHEAKNMVNDIVKNNKNNRDISIDTIDKTLSQHENIPAYNQDIENKKAGYVQGVCECANIVKKEDMKLARTLLNKMGVTKEAAQKYAEPATFKELQKDIYAPPKLEQTREVKRGRSR
jgi:hypothetical protein